MAGILQSLSGQLIETSDFVKTAAANNIYTLYDTTGIQVYRYCTYRDEDQL